MSDFRILVFSPHAELAEALEAALAAHGPEFTVEIVPEYPAIERVPPLLSVRPDSKAFIVDFSDPQRGGDLVAAIAAELPGATIAALTEQASDAVNALAAMKGAGALIAPPFDLEEFIDGIRDSVKDPASPETATPSARTAPIPVVNGKLIAFMPAQGGNGASTISLHVANLMKPRIGDDAGLLFVDFDFHSGAVVFRLRLKERGNLAHALADVSQLDRHWANYPAHWSGFDILPAPVSDSELRPGSLANVKALFSWFKSHYPLTLVDMPTAFYSSCRDVTNLADMTILVCTPQVLSLHLAQRRLQDMFSLGVKPEALRIVLNRADAQTPVEVDDVKEVHGVEVIAQLPNDYQAVNDAYLMGGLVAESSKLGAELSALSAKILEL